jgi:predicted nucleotidyltransferase
MFLRTDKMCITEIYETIDWITPLEKKVLNLAVQKRPECVESVILFGSRARKCSRESSDIDIAFVFCDTEKRSLAMDSALSSIAYDISHEICDDLIDIQIVPIYKTNQMSALYTNIKKEGILLWLKDRTQQLMMN